MSSQMVRSLEILSTLSLNIYIFVVLACQNIYQKIKKYLADIA